MHMKITWGTYLKCRVPDLLTVIFERGVYCMCVCLKEHHRQWKRTMEWNRIDSPEIDQNNHTTLVHDKDGILNH